MLANVTCSKFGGVGDGQADFFILKLLDYVLEAYLLQIEYNVGYVLAHSGDRGELVFDAGYLYCIDGKAFKGGEQDAT